MNPRLILLLTKLQKGQKLTDDELRLLTELDCETRASAEDVEKRCYWDKVTVRAAAEGKIGIIDGIPANYNVLSRPMGGFRERIAPGTFTESMAMKDDEHDVRALVGHDRTKVLAKQSAGTLTLRDRPATLMP
jgi:hypothetical protein